MNQLDVAETLKVSTKKNYFKVLAALSTQLSIPINILGTPKDGLRGYVNGQRLIEFDFWEEVVNDRKGNFAVTDAYSNDAACYKPFLPGLMISTENLQRDASEAKISEEALLEILILHELTHVAMMGKFVRRESAISAEWIESEKIRYIHESVALKACESAFSDLYELAKKSDVEKYLDYVKSQARIADTGNYYMPYFSRFQILPNEQFWHALTQSTAFQWNCLQD